ncbi:hypothetical protein MRX96_043265 [Rhipicephalus microplus]
MDERGDSSKTAGSENKTKKQLKAESGVEKEAAATAGQHKLNHSIPSSVIGCAAVVPVLMAAYQGVKTLYSGSANPPAAAPSTSSQGNQSKADQPPTSLMVAGSSSGVTNVCSHIGRFVDFAFAANSPVMNSLVNMLAHPTTSLMAMSSSAGCTDNIVHSGSPCVASSAASSPITNNQGNQFQVEQPPTSSMIAGSTSGITNAGSHIGGFYLQCEPTSHG